MQHTVSTLGNQFFNAGQYSVIHRTGSPNAHALARLQPWVTMLLTIFPDGHPDMGAIGGAGHARTVKEKMTEPSLVLNTSKRSDH
eukprot:2809113-Karenia_brevis.AAC.1